MSVNNLYSGINRRLRCKMIASNSYESKEGVGDWAEGGVKLPECIGYKWSSLLFFSPAELLDVVAL